MDTSSESAETSKIYPFLPAITVYMFDQLESMAGTDVE